VTVLAFITLADIGESLREAFFMFWATLWALILGFTLSGIVQAFVSRAQMQRAMGDHGPAAVARASGFGMVSSSCSYAATAMGKSLFQKGADFTTAMIFMFASTNLVLELGILLLVLMGWQFALAEFIGGPIMIVLLALTGGVVFTPRIVKAARLRLGGDDDVSVARLATWRERLARKESWADAASYSIADIKMLRRELVIGYVVAGLLTVLVPTEVWNDVFMQGHGWLTSVQNVIIGPFIAIISFVCSIGNVPMAAALWHGGISFGGVISFIFADLITLPLLLIYRKYYGPALTLRILGLFWAVMAIAGLAVEGIFALFGAVPTSRPEAVVPEHFTWNYTTFLNFVFLGVFAVLYWLYRSRARLGSDRYAVDPMCGMQVEKAHAPARVTRDDATFWFCSDHCKEAFVRSAAPETR